MNVPTDLKYTKDHEWVRVDGSTATIGITDYAQSQLGDIVFIEIETEDETLAKGEVFGTIEAVKTVSDMYMALSGQIVEVNAKLEDAPDLVNTDPYGEGWMIKVDFSDDVEYRELLTAGEYDVYAES